MKTKFLTLIMFVISAIALLAIPVQAKAASDKVHVGINFINDSGVQVGGKFGVSELDVDVIDGKGAVFSLDGGTISYIYDVRTNTPGVQLNYFADTKNVQMIFTGSVPENVFIDVEAYKACKVLVDLCGVPKNSSEADYRLDYYIYGMVDGQEIEDGTIMYGGGGIPQEDRYGAFLVMVPLGANFVIVDISDGKGHSLDDFDMIIEEERDVFGKKYIENEPMTEKFYTEYWDEANGKPTIVPSEAMMNIKATPKKSGGSTVTPDKKDEVNPTPTPDVPANENVKNFVGRLYTVALGRAYDEKGLNDWVDKLVKGEQTGAQVAQGFFFSAEFINKNLSDSDYVDTLYRTMFDREADEVGKADWLDALANGMSREFVYRGFAEGAEFKNLCDSFGIQQGKVTLTQNRDKNRLLTAFVARNYTKALGRAAEETGINDWTGRILGGKASPADVTAGFIFSEEFKSKNLSNEDFLKVVYQTYFDREPDSDGYDYWFEKLQSGVAREYVVNNGFSNSQEFRNLVEKFGL